MALAFYFMVVHYVYGHEMMLADYRGIFVSFRVLKALMVNSSP